MLTPQPGCLCKSARNRTQRVVPLIAPQERIHSRPSFYLSHITDPLNPVNRPKVNPKVTCRNQPKSFKPIPRPTTTSERKSLPASPESNENMVLPSSAGDSVRTSRSQHPSVGGKGVGGRGATTTSGGGGAWGLCGRGGARRRHRCVFFFFYVSLSSSSSWFSWLAY